MCKKRMLIVGVALFAILAAFLLPTSTGFQQNAWAEPQTDKSKDKTYVGPAKCALCHLKENTSWKKMKHAQAFEDLSATYKEDKSCLTCHATGFGETSGFKSPKDTPQLAAVVCEACHGPGNEHVKLGVAMAKKEKDKSYWTKEVQSEEWKKDNELRKNALTKIKIPEIKVDKKGQFKGKNLHEMFEEFKNDKGESISLTADICKKCHTSENGKKTHPDYKQ